MTASSAQSQRTAGLQEAIDEATTKSRAPWRGSYPGIAREYLLCAMMRLANLRRTIAHIVAAAYARRVETQRTGPRWTWPAAGGEQLSTSFERAADNADSCMEFRVEVSRGCG
jgi:hypothetical protein